MSRGWPAVLAVAWLATTACASSDPRSSPPASTPTGPAAVASPSGAAVDACALLTPQEIQAVLGGGLVQTGVPNQAGGCSWSAGPNRPDVLVAVVPPAAPGACLETRPDGAQDVSGLGVEAWWEFVRAEVGVGTVTACMPDARMVTLTLAGGADEASLRAAARNLAAIAVERV